MSRNVWKYLLALVFCTALIVSAVSALSDYSFSPAKQNLMKQYKTQSPSVNPPKDAGSIIITTITGNPIVITQIANNYVSGKVTGVSPASSEVAVYIFVPGYGWVNKPFWATPKTTINNDGTFRCLYVTGGHDRDATQFMAFLIPKGTSVPILRGAQTIPSSLKNYPYALKLR